MTEQDSTSEKNPQPDLAKGAGEAALSETVQDVNRPLGFIREFDGTQPDLTDGEKLLAAHIFKQGVENTFLHNVDKYRNSKSIFSEQGQEARLTLKGRLDDGTHLSFVLCTYEAPEHGVDTHKLELFVRSPSSDDYLYHEYGIDEECEEVRRFDDNVQLNKIEGPMTPDLIEEALNSLNDITYEDEYGTKERVEAERSLGMNNLPVSPDEIKGLLALLDQAVPTN